MDSIFWKKKKNSVNAILVFPNIEMDGDEPDFFIIEAICFIENSMIKCVASQIEDTYFDKHFQAHRIFDISSSGSYRALHSGVEIALKRPRPQTNYYKTVFWFIV